MNKNADRPLLGTRRFIRTLIALLAGLNLGACAEKEARTSLPPVPSNLSTFTSGPFGVPPGEWWRERTSDPALAQLIGAALTNSPTLAAAVARIEQARAGVQAQSASRLPYIGGLVSGSAYGLADLQGSGSLAGGVASDGAEVLGIAGLEASYDVDLFGRLAADQRAAIARLNAASADAASVRLALVTDVARNYIAASAAQARAKVARECIAAAQDFAALTQAKVRSGLVPAIDATRGSALLAEAEAALPVLEGERGARIAALVTLTALAPDTIGELVAAASADPRQGVVAIGVPSELIARRPDVKAAIERVAVADAETAAALAARFPRLTISGTVGLIAGTALGGFLPGNTLGLIGGPSLAGPLFDFGRNRAEVARRRAGVSAAVANYRETVLTAFGDVERNLALAAARRRQADALDSLVDYAAETAEIALAQYRSGLTDFLGVLDAQQALFRSRDAAIEARALAADAELALFRAVGGDLQIAAPVSVQHKGLM